jgi:hypothetical protein
LEPPGRSAKKSRNREGGGGKDRENVSGEARGLEAVHVKEYHHRK